MNIVVCVKQIPDPADPGALDPGTKTLKRDSKLILDESDSYGVEMALQLVAAAGGGEVTLVSMSPGEDLSGLRKGLAMGADKGIVVSDAALVGTDALTTARVLAAAIGRAGDVDVVLAATESSDGYTGTVPEQIAEVTAGVVEPRYPSFKGIMAAKSKPVETLSVGDLGIDASTVGWAGAGQEIVDISAAEARQAGEIIEDDGESYTKIVDFLANMKVI